MFYRPKLPDHRYRASASRCMPVYSPYFSGIHWLSSLGINQSSSCVRSHLTSPEFCPCPRCQALQDTPAHQVLRCHIDLSLARSPPWTRLETSLRPFQ